MVNKIIGSSLFIIGVIVLFIVLYAGALLIDTSIIKANKYNGYYCLVQNQKVIYSDATCKLIVTQNK